jgi:CDP-glucose 4,6-dehydratase
VLAQTYAESYRLPVGITRCGNLYGGGDTEWSRIVPGTIRSILRGERPVIRSDGSLVRDYVYVEDAADGVLALAEAIATRPAVAGEAFNFAADARLSVLEIVDRILRVMDSDRTRRAQRRRERDPSSGPRREGPRVLGWRPLLLG